MSAPPSLRKQWREQKRRQTAGFEGLSLFGDALRECLGLEPLYQPRNSERRRRPRKGNK